MVGLPAVGELTYNGFTFDGATHIQVQEEPVPDAAGVANMYVRITINVTAIFQNDDTTDDEINDLRKRLTANGKKLVFKNKGFGRDLNVGGGGRITDVDSGPKTKVISWRPIGSAQACEVKWSVTATIPECESQGRLNGVASITYEISFEVDEGGYTTRRVSGDLVIAQGVVFNKLVDTADDYYDRFINIKPIRGFKRQQNRSLSRDKARLSFTVVDTQIKTRNPLPIGIVNATGRHVQNWTQTSGKSFRNVIEMQLEHSIDFNPLVGWMIFGTTVSKRMLAAMRAGKHVLLDDISVSESIFGTDMSFRVGYRVIGEISQFIGDSDMWVPIGTNWDRWHTSLKNSMFSHYGVSEIQHVVGNDPVVTLCTAPEGLDLDHGGKVQSVKAVQPPTVKNETPPPDKSWMNYRPVVSIVKEDKASYQSYLQGKPTDSGAQEFASPGEAGPPSQKLQFSGNADKDADVQYGGDARYLLRFFGTATRAGHPIPRPKIDRIGEISPKEKSVVANGSIVANMAGVPIYRLDWMVDYYLTRAPGQIDMPDRPDEGVVNESAKEPKRESRQ